MSIILKGVDIHEKFESARLILERNERDGIIRVINESSGEYIGHAIQIPTPHGRLMDKDELLSHLKKDPLFNLVEQYGISGVIESRPTILEAEE